MDAIEPSETPRAGVSREVSRESVQAQLEHLLGTPAFSGAPRRARLLKYLVDRTLAGEGDQVNEYSIGIDVFEKLKSFDPRSDSMVRTDVMRLRQRLRQYYLEEGRADAVVLDVPARTYRVAIDFRETAAEVVPEVVPAPESPAGPNRIRVLIIGAGIAAAGILAGLLLPMLRPHSSAIQSVIVLPFSDFSSDHKSGYLADGLTDEITNDLANLNGLRVIARTTAFEFKGRGIDVRNIGRQLNVDASLEGSLDREGDRLRIRAQLNRNADGYHLWSHVYDVRFRDLIGVQRDIARSIADDLQLSRSLGAGASGNRRHDPTPEAHDLYLQGSEAWNAATPQSFLKGAALFQAAVDRDPEFAEAWLALSNAHWNLGILSGWTGISVAQVESEARRALDADPGLASAHATLGQILWRRNFDWPGAEAEFSLALRYGAGTYNVHNLYAGCLGERGRFGDSHREFRKAQELSPLQDTIFVNEAGLYRAEGKVDEAERMYQQVLARKPTFALALAGMAGLRLSRKDCAGASELAARLDQASPHSRLSNNIDWGLLVCRGELSTARELLSHAPAATPALDMAGGYAALGDAGRALEYLRKGIDLREIGITTLRTSPYFETMHADTRFVALEREIGLGQ